MASIQGKIKQYFLIINSLRKTPNQSSSELLKLFESKDFVISKRTLLRIFESLRDDFGIEIECNRKTNTFSINEELSLNINVFLHFLHTTLQANFVANNIKDAKSMAEYIHLSNISEQKGVDLLQPIYDSIKERKVVEFEHENYITSNIKHYSIEPYLLKEYLNRWYVFGFVKEYDDFRIFGIDRINDLKITDTFFKRDTKIHPATYYENTIGLTFDKYILQEVLIKATEIEAKYLRSQPLHSSQVEHENNQFKLYLTPNYELIQMILMRGSAVCVLKPEWLKKEIRNELLESLKHY